MIWRPLSLRRSLQGYGFEVTDHCFLPQENIILKNSYLVVHRIRNQAESFGKKKTEIFLCFNFTPRSCSRFNIMQSIIDPYATYIVVCIFDALFSVFSKQIILQNATSSEWQGGIPQLTNGTPNPADEQKCKSPADNEWGKPVTILCP